MHNEISYNELTKKEIDTRPADRLPEFSDVK